jgi:hypothetical protein
MSFGITTNGFVRKDRDTIKSELITYARSQLGNDIDFSPYSYEGQLLEITVNNMDQVWQDLETQYYSVYVQSASGVQLDRIGAYSGLTRRAAVKASVPLLFEGTNTTVIPVGFAVQTANGIVFNTTEEVTITLGEATANAEANLAGVGGIVSENSIVEIVNPLAGVDTVNNPLPSFGGLPIESDLDFRARILSLGISGKSSVNAIKKEIDLISGVSNSRLSENFNDFNFNSMPGHSIEAIVSGGDKTLIGQKLYAQKPAGIQSVSNYTVDTGQIKVKAKLKGKIFYQLTLIQSTGLIWYHSVIGNNIEGDNRNFTIYFPASSNYLQLKEYIDNYLSTWLSSEISGDGLTVISPINQMFAADPDNSYVFIDEYNKTQSIEFSRPTLIYIKAIARVKINNDWIAANEALIIENTIKTIGGLYNGITYPGIGIGQAVKEWKLISANNSVVGIDDIDYLFSLSPATPTSNVQIDIQGNEQAQILQSGVTVEYV